MTGEHDGHDSGESAADGTLGVLVTASGEYPLNADGSLGEQQATVAAVIYDRLATTESAYLEMRLTACREYAAEHGWRVVGEHVDIGDDALQDRYRPGLDAALRDVAEAASEAVTDRAVLLVYSHGRLSHDAMNAARWRYQVERAGGAVVTADESDQLASGGSIEPAVPMAKGVDR